MRQPHFGCVELAAAIDQIALRAGQPAAQIGELAGLRTALLHREPSFGLLDFGCAKCRGALGGRGAGSLEPRLVISPTRELGVDARDLAADPRRLLLARLGLLLGAFLVQIVTAQPQDVGQDLLALARGLDGEGVGPALEQEGRVDEGLVVEAQGADDLRLALDQAAVVEELPFAPIVWSRGSGGLIPPPKGSIPESVPNVEMQIALPAPLLAPLPPDAVPLRAQAELELDPHLGLAQGDQLVVAPRRARPHSAQVIASSSADLP